MSIDSSRPIKDGVLLLKDLISGGIADPVSGNRTSTTSKFVMASYPKREVIYPLITISQNGMNGQRAGMNSEVMFDRMRFQVDVWAKDVKYKDEIAGSVIQVLRTSQDTATSGTQAFGLYDFRLINTTDIDDPDIEGVHRKVIEFDYLYIHN